MTTIKLGFNCLQPSVVVSLRDHLLKFPALKHLDLSGNAGLSLLPVAILRVAARLETFNCDGCSLVLPPQLSFSTPDLNPSIIQGILDGRRTFDDEKLELLNVGLTHAVTFEAAALLHCFPFLKHLDLSGNAGLGGSAAVTFVSSLTGMSPLESACAAI